MATKTKTRRFPRNPFYGSAHGVIWSLILLLCAAPLLRAEMGSEGQLTYWKQADGIVILESESTISGDVVLPDTLEGLPVIQIGKQAFNNRDSITSIQFPASLQTLDYRALAYSSGLTEITLPEGVTAIGKECFYVCNYLNTVHLPASLTSIGEYAFANCRRLDNLSIDPANPAYTTTNSVLYNKELTALICHPRGLTDPLFTIPDSVTSLSDQSFFDGYPLREVFIPESVTHIGERAFYNCTNITNCELPSAVATIGFRAFNNCKKIQELTIPAATYYIGSRAFEQCLALQAIYVDPANATYSSRDGILLNKAQTSLITCPSGYPQAYSVPAGVEHIAYRAFYRCDDVPQITLSDSVTTLGDEVFNNCYALTNITLGAQVSILGTRPFLNCSSLQHIEVAPANATFSDIDGVLFNKAGTILLAYPAGRSGPYTVPNGVHTIADSAFYQCEYLTSLSLPDTVKSLERSVLQNCYGLTNLTLSANLADVGQSVLGSCSSLQQITISDSNRAYTTVDGVLFSKDKTRLIEFPDGRTGSYAIPSGTQTLEVNAFNQAAGLSSVSIPADTRFIGSGAFNGCTALRTAIFLGDSPILSKNAFNNLEENFVLYYMENSEGFTRPMWSDLPSDLLHRPALSWNKDGKIQWWAQQGLDYQIESTTNLTSGWIADETLIPGDGLTNATPPIGSADTELYRVQVVLP